MTKRELSTLRKICDSVRANDDLYETVKVVNGHPIKRMKGSTGFYYVDVKEDNGKGFRAFQTFRTIKAAEEFIKTDLERLARRWKGEISQDKPVVLKVTTVDKKNGFIDFIVSSDEQNLYRYEKATGKMRKILGVGKGNFGNAIRGIDRKKIESVAKRVYENNLPFAVIA